MVALGINLPWIDCGHDFGPRPPHWGGSSATPRGYEDLYDELAALADAGLSVTRFWVLAGGVNYPVGENAFAYATARPRALRDRIAQKNALRVRAPGQRPGLPQSFLDDFARLLRVCERAGLRAIPSLVSFEWFQPLVELGGGVTKRGRGDFVFGSARGTDVGPFLDAVLEPLLGVAAAERDAVYAFEAMNEPRWVVHGGGQQWGGDYGPLPSPQTVRPAQMSRFLSEAVERIVAHDLLATIGFGDPEPRWLDPDVFDRLGQHARQGRYLHQRHHYPTLVSDHRLPPHDAHTITPCALGELPTAMGGGALDNLRWRDPSLRESERDPERYLEARLRFVHESQEYPLSLLWSARSEDGRRTWGPAQLAQVRRAAQALGV